METPDTPVVVNHSYKWTTEERIVLVALSLLIVVTIIGWWLGGFHPVLATAALVVLGFMFTWGLTVGARRKKKSALTGVYDPRTRVLTVTGNGLDHTNSGSLRAATGAAVAQIGMNSTLVISLSENGSPSGGTGIHVPQRIGKPLAGILIPFLDKRGWSKNPEVQLWIDGLNTYNR